MSGNSPFPGDGFSNDEMTPDERAKHREMMHKVSDVWPSIESLSNMVKGGKALRGVILVAGVIGAAISYFVKQGFFL